MSIWLPEYAGIPTGLEAWCPLIIPGNEFLIRITGKNSSITVAKTATSFEPR
jgi:hypothetical protein